MLVVEGAHERSVYSISWGRGVVGRGGKEEEEMGMGSDKGLLASTGGDGKINVWSIKVSVSYLPLNSDSHQLFHYSILNNPDRR